MAHHELPMLSTLNTLKIT